MTRKTCAVCGKSSADKSKDTKMYSKGMFSGMFGGNVQKKQEQPNLSMRSNASKEKTRKAQEDMMRRMQDGSMEAEKSVVKKKFVIKFVLFMEENKIDKNEWMI